MPEIRLYSTGMPQPTEVRPLRRRPQHRRMHRERASDTQALRRVYDWGTRILVKDMPSKRERKKQSQDGPEDEGEILSNPVPDLNASIIAAAIIRLYRKRQRLAGATQQRRNPRPRRLEPGRGQKKKNHIGK
jgi:hypothetical protein